MKHNDATASGARNHAGTDAKAQRSLLLAEAAGVNMLARAVVAGIATLFVTLVGCGSTTNNTYSGATCGEGTALVDGVCVAVDASDGEDDTASDTTLASDSVASDTNVADTNVADTSKSDTLGKDSAATDAADAASCTGITINCSTSCGGPSPECPLIDCRRGPMIYTVDLRGSVDRVVIRVPASPGVDPTCDCTAVPKIPYQVVVNTFINAGVYVRARPPAGWRIAAAPCAVPTEQCLVKQNTMTFADKRGFTFGPIDAATAPMGDIVIEEVTASDTCP